ncbi:MAG: hypothetical protein IJS68_00790 [Clostridia bacterium]|nr:hypothetical protein [Clostridia bacterium]
MNLESKLELIRLYDLYSNLLTPKQSEVVSLYLVQDVGYSEIAQILGISRQAVYDLFSVAQRALYDAEKTIGFDAFKQGLKKDLSRIASIPEDAKRKTELKTIIDNL